jgi:hypothetical protein
VIDFAKLYDGEFFPFTISLMGVFYLCIFYVVHNVGAEGIILLYFHLCSFCMMFCFFKEVLLFLGIAQWNLCLVQ